MNFYMGLEFENIDYFNDYNVRIDAEILEYLYRNSLKLNVFYDIDPYDDIILKKEEILNLVKDCDIILSSNLIKREECNDYMDNPIPEFKALRELCLKSLEEEKNIISVGD